MKDGSFSFSVPVEVYFGVGELERIDEICRRTGERAALIIDPFFENSQFEQRIVKALGEKLCLVFREIKPDPTEDAVDCCAAEVISKSCDFIVAAGGGSTLDTAKAVAAVAANGGKCWDYCYHVVDRHKVVRERNIEKDALPVIAIPTTAGTGSEATFFGLISNDDMKFKSNVIHKSLYPKVSIVDPELMVSLPAKQTAYTGMDTFCHAFENLIAVNANHFSRMFSIEAIKLVACSIRRAVNNGEDLEARAMLALASTYGGIANANGGGTTLVHDIGIPLSVYYNIPHGASLTVTLSEIIRWTLPYAMEDCAQVARILNPQKQYASNEEAAFALADSIDSLLEDIGIRSGLSDFGVSENGIKVILGYLRDNLEWDFAAHPRHATLDDVKKILIKCL